MFFSVNMENMTVTDVDWSGSWPKRGNLTETSVTKKLKRLTGFVRKLDLKYNSLTSLPDFTIYRLLDSLQQLDLSANTIQTLVWDNVPRQVDHLDLSFNQLENIPTFSQSSRCMQVKQLHLYFNKIHTVYGDSIPG